SSLERGKQITATGYWLGRTGNRLAASTQPLPRASVWLPALRSPVSVALFGPLACGRSPAPPAPSTAVAFPERPETVCRASSRCDAVTPATTALQRALRASQPRPGPRPSPGRASRSRVPRSDCCQDRRVGARSRVKALL